LSGARRVPRRRALVRCRSPEPANTVSAHAGYDPFSNPVPAIKCKRQPENAARLASPSALVDTLGIKSKVWVNRGHEPANPFYEYTEVENIGALAAAVGLEPFA
jgi:hypothetical protein